MWPAWLCLTTAASADNTVVKAPHSAAAGIAEISEPKGRAFFAGASLPLCGVILVLVVEVVS